LREIAAVCDLVKPDKVRQLRAVQCEEKPSSWGYKVVYICDIILNTVRQHNHFISQGNYKVTCFDYRFVILRPILSIVSQDAMYTLGSHCVYIHGIHQIKSFVSKGVTCELCLRHAFRHIHTCKMLGRDSVVGIATRYGLDGPGIESRWGTRFSAPVQTCHEAHPASWTMGKGSFRG